MFINCSTRDSVKPPLSVHSHRETKLSACSQRSNHTTEQAPPHPAEMAATKRPDRILVIASSSSWIVLDVQERAISS